MNRRQFLGTSASALALAPLQSRPPRRAGKRMGISIATYAYRWQAETDSPAHPAFTNALQVLEHAHRLDAGGVQIGVRGWTEAFAGQVRDAREQMGLYLEGQIALPRTPEDVERFDREVQNAREAGASIIRTVCLSGRRYETFQSLEEFQAFRAESVAALERAEPIVRRHRVKLAVENHKDWRTDELISILDHLGSAWMGATLDTGNNLALLDDPMAVVERLAPYAFTTHFKDMAVAPYDDGFLLSEVPLGAGLLDLHRVIEVCEVHHPDVTFNLEMITRDPLPIPCLTDPYWETFPDVNGRDLARMVRLAKPHDDTRLPRVSGRTPAERLAFEEQNVVDSFRYARETLGLK